jgi:hypothetical protein
MVVEIMRRIRTRTTAAILGAAAALVLGTSADAALLNSGSTLFPAPGEVNPVGGTVLANQTIPFLIPGFFDGTLTSTVIQGDTSNPFGGLTFTYRLNNATTSPNAMARFTVGDFTGFQVDASFQSPGTGVAPTLIDRLTADVVGYSYSQAGGPGPIFPNSSSGLMVVQTNAAAFAPTLANIIDSAAISILSFGPIPEPGSLGVLAAGAVMLIRRRR